MNQTAGHDDNPEPKLVRGDALRGTTVGISVSDSADLSRLGLTPAHCELAVAELARAIFVAGGTIIYGGRLPGGFTDILLDELRRYRDDRDALILCVAESEHGKLSDSDLARRAQELHSSARLVCLDQEGQPVDPIRRKSRSAVDRDVPAALTAMRRYVTNHSDARVLVGGKLLNYEGTVPGVIEEAILAIAAAQPLYVAGGFGGAAGACVDALDSEQRSWHPSDLPEGATEQAPALVRLISAVEEHPLVDDGLSASERRQLGVTHRPGDIASLVVKGLGRLSVRSDEGSAGVARAGEIEPI